MKALSEIEAIEQDRITRGGMIPPSFVGIEAFSRKIQEGITGDSTAQKQLDLVDKILKLLEEGGYKKGEGGAPAVLVE
jgi:hypothetical protein